MKSKLVAVFLLAVLVGMAGCALTDTTLQAIRDGVRDGVSQGIEKGSREAADVATEKLRGTLSPEAIASLNAMLILAGLWVSRWKAGKQMTAAAEATRKVEG